MPSSTELTTRPDWTTLTRVSCHFWPVRGDGLGARGLDKPGGGLRTTVIPYITYHSLIKHPCNVVTKIIIFIGICGFKLNERGFKVGVERKIKRWFMLHWRWFQTTTCPIVLTLAYQTRYDDQMHATPRNNMQSSTALSCERRHNSHLGPRQYTGTV